MASEISAGRAASRARIDWIDTARGIGIVLVVYGHALRGLVSAKLLASDTIVLLQDHVIYAFHMPFFFLLSGLFAGRAAAARPGDFLRKRLVTIVYPYFLWSIAQTLLSGAAQSYANNPGALTDLRTIAWEPVDQFWFLYMLAICNLLLLLPRWMFYLLVPVGMLLKIEFGNSDMLSRAGFFLPYFAAGVWLTAPGLSGLFGSRRRAAAWLILGGAAFALLLAIAGPLAGPDETAMSFVVAAAGIAAALGLARLLAGPVWLLAILGAASMPIYVLHVIVGAAVRAILIHFHLTQPVIALSAITASGLLVPVIIYQVAVKARLSTWLGLGYPPPSPGRSRRGGDGHHPLELTPANADVEPTQRA